MPPPSLDRFVVGVTGHRHLGAGTEERIAEIVGHTLERLREEHGGRLIALSALAAGADSLFAERARDLGIRLEAVLPFEGYRADFAAGPERERYEGLLAEAERVHTLPRTERSDAAYAEAGRWVVDHSDHLVAIWDGEPARGRGGTGDIVAYARERELPLTLVPAGERPPT